MTLATWSHPYREYPEGADGVAEMTDRLGALRDAGIELVFPFVAVDGAAYFESETLGPPERDLLAPLMEAARSVGMRVHPITGLGGPLGGGGGVYEPPHDDAPVPDWARGWPCASWGENHERGVLIAGEILDAYAPEGIHLDYVRYPNSSLLNQAPCACDRCRQARLRWLGKPYPDAADLRRPGSVYREIQMRVEFVRSFVESMRGLVDEHGAMLSAAVRARYYEDAVVEGQDWAEWCADGLLDIVCPMSYTLSFGLFARMMAQHRRLTGDCDVQWLAGIGLKSSAGELDVPSMERQVRFALRAEADGACIFHANAIGPEELSLLEGIASGGE